jgi:hypothetical protein
MSARIDGLEPRRMLAMAAPLSVVGTAGDDSIVANDGERDSLFDGTGSDSARIDSGLDSTDGIESVI